MSAKMKFHAMAIGIISLVTIILYVLIGPTPRDANPTLKSTDRYARITSATYGMACNQQINDARTASESIPLSKDADGKVIPATTWKQATTNNALETVKKFCEGNVQCEVMAADDILGINLPAGCYKKLNVNYRCSNMDRMVVKDIDQGQALKIDCSDAAAAATTHKP